MPVHPFQPPRGRIENLTIDSTALEGNLLGDPTRRTVAVYLPEGYDDTDADYPLFVDLAGFTGSGLKRLAWSAFGENTPQRLDRLVAAGKMGPVIVAFPDCFTSLGGNQYVDSPALGQWERFLLDEMLPRLETTFRIRRGPAHRAVYGKSSGGYGSIVQGLKHGEQWAALACHSGDMGFDNLYRRDLPLVQLVLDGHGGIEGFLDHLATARKIRGNEMHALMMLAMAPSYDPDPSAPKGIRLPVDPHTCELDEAAWARWLAHDPVRMIDRSDCQASLRKPRLVYIDCGNRDQYFCHFGARAFVRKLERFDIAHRYEEFDDDHSSVDYRNDVSFPLLYAATTR